MYLKWTTFSRLCSFLVGSCGEYGAFPNQINYLSNKYITLLVKCAFYLTTFSILLLLWALQAVSKNRPSEAVEGTLSRHFGISVPLPGHQHQTKSSSPISRERTENTLLRERIHHTRHTLAKTNHVLGLRLTLSNKIKKQDEDPMDAVSYSIFRNQLDLTKKQQIKKHKRFQKK